MNQLENSIQECPACGGVNCKFIVAINSDNRERFYEFSKFKYRGRLDKLIAEVVPEINSCLTCGHCWYKRHPSSDQLSEMYASSVEQSVERIPSAHIVEEMLRLKKLSSKISPLFLDFGSGYGRWARAAEIAGMQVYAFEPSKARGEEFCDNFTLVHDLSFLSGMKFDLINLEQVLEHVSNPLETLIKLRNYCHSETILRISVPNVLRCPEGKDIWNLWPYDGNRVHTMAPFEHLHGFTPTSILKLIKRSGFAELPAKDILFRYSMLLLRRFFGKMFPRIDQALVFVRLLPIHSAGKRGVK